jgi:alpha-galactosidase/6-phospho-beta-glucosidase family protein
VPPVADLILAEACRNPQAAVALGAERLAHAERLVSRISAQAGAGATVTVTATMDRRAALDGARYVINEVQVGGYSATRADFDIPARYGVRQTIGDAYLLSYSNPMATLPWAVYEGTAFSRVFGLCHSVRDTQAFLTSLVGARGTRAPKKSCRPRILWTRLPTQDPMPLSLF